MLQTSRSESQHSTRFRKESVTSDADKVVPQSVSISDTNQIHAQECHRRRGGEAHIGKRR